MCTILQPVRSHPAIGANACALALLLAAGTAALPAAGANVLELIDDGTAAAAPVLGDTAGTSVPTVAGAASAFALHGLFSDHMVLQRDVSVPVWGTAPAGTTVAVEWRAETHTATADESGRWLVPLPPTPLGGPFTLVARSGDATLTVRDVLVGEVWLCSGQSNMVWTVAQSHDAEREQAAGSRCGRWRTCTGGICRIRGRSSHARNEMATA